MSQFEKTFLIILIVYCASSLGQLYSIPVDLFGFIILFTIGFYIIAS